MVSPVDASQLTLTEVPFATAWTFVGAVAVIAFRGWTNDVGEAVGLVAAVGLALALADAVGDAELVAVAVALVVAVAVVVFVGVAVELAVAVALAVRVGVGVLVGEAVGVLVAVCAWAVPAPPMSVPITTPMAAMRRQVRTRTDLG